jgi:hypothetical protein
MRRCHIAALTLLLVAAGAAADNGKRRTLDRDDYAMVNNLNLEYNLCLQKKGMARIEKQDVRVALQAAVDECRGVLENLVQEFDKRQIDPAYYQGVVSHLKTDAIRRQLPNLMMYKANGGQDAPAQERQPEPERVKR